ncbi:hypothetical protein D1224_01700 [Henriciella barbarensis]|uniref:Uncharacterized protein n=1 Tax=Henriciella barbarensis TaxID=86342 RepID=A0A399R8M4_9PROT|nr:hypothetical protein D1224_01700 [Henriciella barbarensis]
MIARVWPRLVALVAGIAAMLEGAGASDRAMRLRAMRLLRPAEALARRIITLLADRLEADLPPLRDGGGQKRPEPVRRRHSAGFVLFEPVATCAASISRPGRGRRFHAGPRIVDVLGLIAVSPTQRDTPAKPRLEGRIAALQKAVEAPERHALRLARRRARALSSDGPRPRLTPLRPGWPPGIRGRETPGWLTAVLDDLTVQIRCRPPPSF